MFSTINDFNYEILFSHPDSDLFREVRFTWVIITPYTKSWDKVIDETLNAWDRNHLYNIKNVSNNHLFINKGYDKVKIH